VLTISVNNSDVLCTTGIRGSLPEVGTAGVGTAGVGTAGVGTAGGFGIGINPEADCAAPSIVVLNKVNVIVINKIIINNKLNGLYLNGGYFNIY